MIWNRELILKKYKFFLNKIVEKYLRIGLDYDKALFVFIYKLKLIKGLDLL